MNKNPERNIPKICSIVNYPKYSEVIVFRSGRSSSIFFECNQVEIEHTITIISDEIFIDNNEYKPSSN